MLHRGKMEIYTERKTSQGEICVMKLYTIKLCYQEICTGEGPWLLLGNFMNDWYAYHRDRRTDLIKDPIEIPENPTLHQKQWASFCAASVEYLCQLYEMFCPEWALSAKYILIEPWYYSFKSHKPEVRARLEVETPRPFTQRGIYCGNRIFMNKYEELPVRELQLA